MNRIIITLLLVFGLSQVGYTQDVKIKKKIAYIDGVAFLKYRYDYGKTIISTMNDKDIILFNNILYDVPNPKSTLKQSYYIISFVDFEMEFETEVNLKGLFSALYKFKVVNDDGSIQTENAEKMKKMIAQDVSSTIPKVVIHK